MVKEDIHKINWGKSLFSKGIWYFMSSMLTKGLGFILLPIYTKYLPPLEYGILQNINAIALVLPMLLSLALDAAFIRFYHDIKNNRHQMSYLFSTLYWFILLYGSLVLLLVIITSYWWFPIFFDIPIFPYVYLSFLPVLLMQLSLLGSRFFEQSLRTRSIMVIDLFSALVNGGLSILLLVKFNLGVLARLEGIAAGTLLSFIFYTLYFVKSGVLRLHFSISILKEGLIYSIPLMPSLLGSWIYQATDKLVITHYVDTAASGLYAFAGILAIGVYFIGNSVSRVLNPIILSGLVDDKLNTKNKMSKTALFMWGFMLWLVLIVTLFAKDLVNILATEKYENAYVLIPVISFIYVLGMQYRFPLQVLSFYKKTLVISIGGIIAGVSNLLLNLWLVPIYGYEIAAWTTIVSSFIYTFWIFYWGQSLDKVYYPWVKYLLVFFIFLVIIFFSTQFKIILYKMTFLNILIKLFIGVFSAMIILLVIDKNILIKGMKTLNNISK